MPFGIQRVNFTVVIERVRQCLLLCVHQCICKYLSCMSVRAYVGVSSGDEYVCMCACVYTRVDVYVCVFLYMFVNARVCVCICNTHIM